MEDKLIEMIEQLGTEGIWLILAYKTIDIIGVVIILLLIGYGTKKAWPALTKFLSDI